MDIEKFAEQAAAAVRSVMQRELARIEQRTQEAHAELVKSLAAEIEAKAAALAERLDQLEARLQEQAGKSITGDEVRQLVDERVSALPVPKDGTSVTLDDVRPMIEEHLRSIPVPKDGTSVTVEDVRPMIDAFLGGLRLPEDGKDALEIVIQPDLDAAKSYPRGTFAAFAGGLVRSNRKTTPLGEVSSLEDAGWSVIVRGIAGAELEYPTERTIRAVFRYTDGTKTATEVRAPFVLDKGVFREGTAYEAGDGVTFGGSYWIAQKDAPEGKPGTSADWRLAVKKGRDGADARADR